MKTIRKDELYENLSQFLKSKGIELTEGSYTKSVHAGCSLLADAVNLSQAGLERAKNELEKRLDQVRQVIHETTAPRKPATEADSGQSPSGAPGPKSGVRSGGSTVHRRSPRPKTSNPKITSKRKGSGSRKKGT
jgi:hypothetical protein